MKGKINTGSVFPVSPSLGHNKARLNGPLGGETNYRNSQHFIRITEFPPCFSRSKWILSVASSSSKCCLSLDWHACSNFFFFKSVVTGDGSRCFHFDTETKRQSMEGDSKNSQDQRKFTSRKLKVKTMLVTFFDSEGVIYKYFVAQGVTSDLCWGLSWSGHWSAPVVWDRIWQRLATDILCMITPPPPGGAFSPHREVVFGMKKRGGGSQCWNMRSPLLLYSPDLAPVDFEVVMWAKLGLHREALLVTFKDAQLHATVELRDIPSK